MYTNCLQLTSDQLEDVNLFTVNIAIVPFTELPFNWKLHMQEENIITSFFLCSLERKKKKKVDVSLCSRENIRKLTYCAISHCEISVKYKMRNEMIALIFLLLRIQYD